MENRNKIIEQLEISISRIKKFREAMFVWFFLSVIGMTVLLFLLVIDLFLRQDNNKGSPPQPPIQSFSDVEDFNKAIELNPQDAEAYYNRGRACSKKGELDNAIRDFNKAIELNPDFAHAYWNRGETQLRLKEWQKAKADLTTAKDMGVDIIASFQNEYESVEAFETKNGVTLPKDIAALLQRK